MRKAPFSRWLPGVSRGALASLLLAAPAAAFAAGFAGTTTLPTGVSSANSGNTQTLTILPSNPVTTITWTPTNAPVNGTINFLPSGNTEAFVGTPSQGAIYTVLNRIISSDATNVIAFNGAVTSTANTRLWFYSPGGLLIGSTASFNVGGLVLTTAAPTLNGNNSYITTSAGTDSFGFTSPAGSTSAITIQPGATISAVTSAHSNYIVAIAPQINQGGAISVSGSVALVAAESATFAVDSQALFNITVSSGTTVSSNTFINSGAVGGPNAAASGSNQRVYMVAVPKNNAISMAISAGGNVGFAAADAANLDGDTVVLSAGSNIADTGTGNPVVAGRAGSGTASLTVGGGNYTSNTYAVSTDSATVSDPALSIGFSSGLTVIAPTATVNALAGTISVGGDLSVDADDTLTGLGGTASLQANGGSITVTGNALVSAAASWTGGTQNPGNQITTGGTAQVAVVGNHLNVGGTLTVDASADGTGANAALSSTANTHFDDGADAIGGSASLTVSGASASLLATGGISVRADAISSFDQNGSGGFANAGTALIEAETGGAISVGQNGAIAAAADASEVAPPSQQAATYTFGGESTGGTAQVIANAGTISVAGVDGITAFANASGGSASSNYSGSGGNATGGTALIAVQGASGSITTNTSGATVQTDFATAVEANATAGDASGYNFSGGNAIGGTATLQVTGVGQSIAIDHGNSVLISAQAVGGLGADNGGGTATGGTAQLLASHGSIAITNTPLSIDAAGTGGGEMGGNAGEATGGLVQLAASNSGSISTGTATLLDAAATGGSSPGANGGDATGGTVKLTASGGGTVTIDASPYIIASATGGNGSNNGGDALGGNIFISLGNNAINFDSASGVPELDASYTPGAGSSHNGTGSTEGGVLLTDLGTLTLGGALTIDGNTQLYAQAGGSIAVTGSIAGTGAGAYLHLWADDLGTGTGAVTLANGALNLPGNLIDIYYNPTSLGTPTDFSAGITAGTATAYQLVDNIDQLQFVGSYLSQNFALGKNIDASATQGWNGGAGFVPIGSSTTAFTGNFDGLNHTVTNLYIDTPNSDSVGLFGEVNAGANGTVIRNVGLVAAQINGLYNVGGLIGRADAGSITISNSFSTGTQTDAGGAPGAFVTGRGQVGGLIGLSSLNNTISNVHSDAAVSGNDIYIGGLIGYDGGATITNAFATGSVTATGEAIGGLIGEMDAGSLSQAYATGAVNAAGGSNYIGGLVGIAVGTISKAYAVGSVTAGSGSYSIGGLVGDNAASINESWASGAISVQSGANVGGFVGDNLGSGTITNSYWDTYSTGQTAGVGTNNGTVTNLNPVTSDPTQASGGHYAFNPGSYSNFSSGDWLYDDNATRPTGAWEAPVPFFGVATVDSAHQVQLIDLNMAGSYTITQNIDMSGTGGTSDIWGPGGFLPLGGEYSDPPFTGTLEGAGHVLSNLTMAPNGYFVDVGLVQDNYGTISDLGLANVNITASYASTIGAIAGDNAGPITDSFATGTITLTQSETTLGAVAGGLAGLNYDGAPADSNFSYFAGNRGTITQSYATVAVSGPGAAAGGLVGDNEGGISGSFANGLVSGGTLRGGLVGESTDSAGPAVTNSYWDTQLTGQSGACGSTGFSGACSGVTGLTTAQTLQAASFTGFTIDTVGGQGLPWRQYEGNTTPLLEAFLTPITVQPGSLETQYDADVQTPGYTTYGAQPGLTFGTAQLSGLARNVGITEITYTGGLYSNQLGYDFVPSTTSGTLQITPAPLTLGATPDYKTYDGTTNAVESDGVFVSGKYGNDYVSNLSESFTSKNVMGQNGSTLVVNDGYVINDGNGGNNYTVTLQSAEGTIVPAQLTLSAVSDSKVYDATTTSAGVVQASGLFGADNVTSLTQSFTSKNVMGTNGSTLVVNSNYVVNDGNGGNNYTVSLQNAQGTITPAPLTIGSTPETRVYNATTASFGDGVYVEGILGNDDVGNLSQSYVSPNVMGTNASTIIVNPGYVISDGNSGNNYSVTLLTSQGTITPAPLTLAAVTDTKVYDATTHSAGVVQTSGLFGADNVTSLTQSFASKNVLGANGSTLVVNTGYVVNDGNGGNNYTVTLQNAQGTITPAPLTLAAVSQTRVYDATTNSSGVPQAIGLLGSDNVNNLSQSFASKNVLGTNGSTLAVNPGYAVNDGNDSNNYTVTLQTASGTITPAPLTITYVANTATSTYGTTPSGLSGLTSEMGLQGSDTLAAVTAGTASFTTTATAQSSVGHYAIDGSGLTANSNNYSFSFIQAPGNAIALTIIPAMVTVDVLANPVSRSYGTANPTLTYTETGLANGDMLTGSLATTATITSNVGVYPITQGTLSAGSNYTLDFTGSNLTVTPASLTVTYTANPLTSIYGTVPSGLSGSVSSAGLVLNQTLGSVTSGTALFSTTAGATSNVGSYAVTGSGLTANSSNYTFNFVQASGNATALTIDPATLDVIANPQSRTYGATNPTFTYSETGLVNGDTLSGNLATVATTASNVGNYAITLGSLSAGNNYTLNYTGANLTINPASLTVTYTANPASSIYGTVPSGLSGSVSAAGLVLNQTLGSVTSGTAAFTTTAGATSNVGNYAVTGSGLTANSSNYTFSFVQAPGNATALTIDPATLDVIANPQSRTYGATNPTLTYSETGLVNGDTLSGSLATVATTASNVGNYAITLGSLSAGNNYTLNYTGANLTINPASLTVTYTANPASSIYGNAPTGLSGSESAAGLVNADSLASVTSGTASFATTATGTSNVGSYAITGSGLTANSGNYTFTFVQAPGNASALTITARALTLTADPLSRVYGGTNPTSDTATAAPATGTTGLVNGDSIGSETVTSAATSGTGVGTYAIDGSAAQFSTGLGSNYAITYATNTSGLTITPAALTLTYTAAPGSSTYGQAPTGLTGSIALTGLVNEDSAASVTTGSALWTSPATAASNVGTYAINGSGIGLASANYTLTTVQAPGNATALTVNPASLSIVYTANPASRAYGAENPELSGTEMATGLVNGDTLGSVTSGEANFTTAAGATSNVGNYAETGAGLSGTSLNYSYSFTQATGNATALTINPALVTITYTANPLTSVYGNAVPTELSGTASASGLVNEDTLASVTSGTASFATTASSTSNVGAYAITGSGLSGDNGNYSFSFAQASGNATALTITPRPITVTADPQQRAVGAANPAFTYVVTSGTEGTTQALVNGDTLTGQLSTTATIDSPAGKYDILQGSLAASENYQLTYVGNILTLAYASLPIQSVIDLIETDLTDQPASQTPQQRKQQEAAELAALLGSLGLHPLQMSQNMINDRLVTTPPPVTEPVTSNGNSSLWSPGAP